MKIYFGFTVAGDRSTLENARKIVGCLEDLGHEVVTRHLVNDDARAADRELGSETVYRRDMAWLLSCDLLVAETSGSSFGVGYEAGYLLAGARVKVILFYRREMDGKISFLITGNTHPNCTVVPYSSFEEIRNFLKHHVGTADQPPQSPSPQSASPR